VSWHDKIDETLHTLRSVPFYPNNVALDDSLRTTLAGVENDLASDPVAFRVAKAMTDTVIDPMVTDIAGRPHPYIGHLTILRGWRDHPPALYAATRNMLDLTAGLFHPNRGLTPRQLNGAFIAASFLVSKTYPIDYENPTNPQTEPTGCNILDATGMFAVVSTVHTVECGPERNQQAISELAETITLITERG